MSRVFLLLPGISRWEFVEVEPPPLPIGRPIISGRLSRSAVVRASGGPTPPIQNREPRK